MSDHLHEQDRRAVEPARYTCWTFNRGADTETTLHLIGCAGDPGRTKLRITRRSLQSDHQSVDLVCFETDISSQDIPRLAQMLMFHAKGHLFSANPVGRGS